MSLNVDNVEKLSTRNVESPCKKELVGGFIYRVDALDLLHVDNVENLSTPNVDKSEVKG